MPTAVPKKNIKVFIVDSDKFILGMYAVKFSNNGYDVDISADSRIALEKFRAAANPDILLLDMVMPGMDGIELMKTIRAEKLAPNMAVIMLTNQSQSSDVERAKQLGVDGYIIKASTIPSEVITEVERIYSAKKIKK